MIADRRRLAVAAFGLRPLDAFDRIVGDGVLLAQIFEQRGQRSQPVPDRRAAESAPAHTWPFCKASRLPASEGSGQAFFPQSETPQGALRSFHIPLRGMGRKITT